MKTNEKVMAICLAVLLGLALGLTLQVSHTEAAIAWDSFKQTSTAGREEAAAGYLTAAAIYRSTELLALGLAVVGLAIVVALSRLRRKDERIGAKSDAPERGPSP